MLVVVDMRKGLTESVHTGVSAYSWKGAGNIGLREQPRSLWKKSVSSLKEGSNNNHNNNKVTSKLKLRHLFLQNRHWERFMLSSTSNKSVESSLCRLCNQKDETINHIISKCKMLANKEYKRRHDNIARLVHWKLCLSMTWAEVGNGININRKE